VVQRVTAPMTERTGSHAPRGNAGPEVARGAVAAPLLEVRDLRTYFHTDAGDARAVDGISFSIASGKTLAIVGESGCGKTVTALSLLQLIPQPPGEFVSGEIRLFGRDLLKLAPPELREIRG